MIIILILQLLMQLFLMNELACWLKRVGADQQQNGS